MDGSQITLNRRNEQHVAMQERPTGVERTGGTIEQLPSITLDDDHAVGEALTLSAELSARGSANGRSEGRRCVTLQRTALRELDPVLKQMEIRRRAKLEMA